MKKFTLFLFALFTSIAIFAQTQMSGEYTVGTGGTYDYASLADAGMDIKSAEFTGNVTLLICTDLTETINTGIVNKSNYTLTIRPDKDENRTITYTTAKDNTGPTGVFVIGGDMTKTPGSTIGWASVPTKNVIVDGAAAGYTTPRLKITNEVFGTNVLLYGDVQDVIIRNCILVGRSGSKTAYALVFRSEDYSKTSKNIGPKNCVVENCIIESASTQSQVVYCQGYQANSYAGWPTNITIRNCSITSHLRGIFLYGVNNFDMEGCVLKMLETTTGYICHGVLGNTTKGVINIKGNKFIKNSTKNAKAGEYGLQTITASGGATEWVIENNYFAGYDALASGTTTIESRLVGIRCGDYCVVRHNTFHMPKLTYAPGTSLVGTHAVALLWLAGSHKYPVQNNIFVCEETAANVSLIRGGLNENVTGNVFYHNGGKAAIVAAAPSCMTFADLETSYSTQAATSKWKNVTFTDAANGDLSLDGSSDGDANLAVDRLAEVLTDINGKARREKTYAGAYEGSEFPAEVCNVTATVAPVGSGTVEGAGDYAIGSSITLTATPAAHYDFESWTGDVTSTDNPLTLTVSSNITVTANFQEHAKCTITAVANDDNMGTVTGGNIYYVGESVTLKATAKTGCVFAGWTDGEKNATRTVVVSGDATYTANFQAIAPRAWAYDLKVVEDGDNYMFTFNATAAGSATLLFADIDGNELVAAHAVGTVAAGANTVTLAKTTFEGVTKDVYWSVKMDGEAIPAISEITDASKGIYNFYLPQGVAVDNNPESSTFSKIYIAESTDGASDGGSDRADNQKRGIFIYDQTLAELNPTNKGIIPSNVTLTNTTRNALKRIAINPKTNEVAFAYNASPAAVWAVSTENVAGEATNLLAGLGFDYCNSLCFDENGILYIFDNGAGYPAKGSLYKIVNGEKITIFSENSKYGNADNSLASDGRGGLWIYQNRGQLDAFNQLSHINANGEIDFEVNSTTPHDFASLNTSRGAMAYNPRENILAIGIGASGTIGVSLYQVTYNPSTGVPSLEYIGATPSLGKNVEGIAFDYAGDLYALSANTERFYKFTLPTDENICTVPAPSSQKLVLGTQCEVTVTVTDPAMGSVEGAGQYEKGATVELKATANEHYQFVNWTKGAEVLSTENPYSFTVQEDVTIIANFAELPTYTITVQANNNAMGSVEGGGTVHVGESVEIKAIPNSGHAFVKWDDGNTEATRTVEVVGDKTYTAIFQAMNPRAWAYDLRMVEDGDNYKFTFKATSASDATLLFTNKAGTPVAPTSYAVGSVEAGEKSVTIAQSEFGGTEDIYWSVQMDGAAIENMIEITDASGNYDFFMPQDVKVDNSPNSMYFGQVYVAAAVEGAARGGTQKRGIFVYDQKLAELNTPNVGYLPANVTLTDATRHAIHRLAVNPINGYVAFAYNVSGSSAVWSMNPADMSGNAVNLIDNSITAANSICFDEEGALYVMDNANAGSIGGQIYKEDENGKLNLFAAHNKDFQWANADNALAPDGRGGLWIAQNRWQVDGYPVLSHVDKDGLVDFAVTSSSSEALKALFPYDDNNASYRGQCAYYAAEDILAFGGNKEAVLFKVTYDINNVPTNLEKLMSTGKLGTNIDGLAFDYAGDLYVASETTHRMYKFVIPTADNTCTVPAPKSQAIKKEARYTVTVAVNDNAMGTATGGGTEFLYGDEVTVNAVANTNYEFVNWTENDVEVSTSAEYTFNIEGIRNLVANFQIEPLKIKGIVKRAVQVGESTVVLTHEGDGTPHLYKVVDGTLEAEISQEGVVAAAAGYLSISDIAATEDGKLVACNYIECTFEPTNTSYFYIWNAIDEAPAVWFTSQKSTNYNNAYMGWTMAVKGTSTDAVVTISGFNKSNKRTRFSHLKVVGGSYDDATYEYSRDNAALHASVLGNAYELNASPLASANWIIDAELTSPIEFEGKNGVEIDTYTTMSETFFGKKFNGATYFSIASAHFMVAPYADAEGKVVGVKLMHITRGLAAAKELQVLDLATPEVATAAATAVLVEEVDNADGQVSNDVIITLITDAKVHILTTELDIYVRDIDSGTYGTVCLPNNAIDYTGASLFEVAGKENGKLYFDEITTMEAGEPYLLLAEQSKLIVVYGTTSVVSPTNTGVMKGTFDKIVDDGTILEGNYMIYNNTLQLCGAGCWLNPYRAYFGKSELDALGKPMAPMPGRRRVEMGGVSDNETTGLENITEGTGAIAPMVEGTYDVLGRELSEPNATGFYIINGKKVVIVK